MQERSLVQNRPNVCFLDHRYSSYEACVEGVGEWGEKGGGEEGGERVVWRCNSLAFSYKKIKVMRCKTCPIYARIVKNRAY